MSNKIVVEPPSLSTADVDNSYSYTPPQLDEHGREIISQVTLVAVADLRPVTLGERIRRYMKTPQFLQDLHNEDGYHDENIEEVPDEDENPITRYETRAADIVERVKARKQKAVEDEKEKLIAEEKASKDAFRKRFKELQLEGATLPPPTSSNEA